MREWSGPTSAWIKTFHEEELKILHKQLTEKELDKGRIQKEIEKNEIVRELTGIGSGHAK